jgi:hypothetical protein
LALASQLAIVADAACGFNFYGSSLVKKDSAGKRILPLIKDSGRIDNSLATFPVFPVQVVRSFFGGGRVSSHYLCLCYFP